MFHSTLVFHASAPSVCLALYLFSFDLLAPSLTFFRNNGRFCHPFQCRFFCRQRPSKMVFACVSCVRFLDVIRKILVFEAFALSVSLPLYSPFRSTLPLPHLLLDEWSVLTSFPSGISRRQRLLKLVGRCSRLFYVGFSLGCSIRFWYSMPPLHRLSRLICC